MATTQAPSLKISSSGVSADIEGDIKVNVKTPGEPLELVMLLGAVCTHQTYFFEPTSYTDVASTFIRRCVVVVCHLGTMSSINTAKAVLRYESAVTVVRNRVILAAD